MSSTTTARLLGSGPIVIVDDDETDTYLMTRAHERSGVANELVTFDGGPAFLAYVENLDPSVDVPALVILGSDMPEMDGFEVVEALRANDGFHAVPIIMFSTSSDRSAERARAEQCGCELVEQHATTAEAAAFLASLAS